MLRERGSVDVGSSAVSGEGEEGEEVVVDVVSLGRGDAGFGDCGARAGGRVRSWDSERLSTGLSRDGRRRCGCGVLEDIAGVGYVSLLADEL